MPVSEREERARRLIKVGHALETAYIESFLGSTVSVMVEDENAGYSREYIRVKVEGEAAVGTVVNVIIDRVEGLTAIGHIA